MLKETAPTVSIVCNTSKIQGALFRWIVKEGQAHRRSEAACILGIGEIRGADAPQPAQGSLEKGRGLVLGKTKSDVEAAVIRETEAGADRRTHPPRAVEPRTTAKGVFTGRNRTLLFAAIIALPVLRTRPLIHVAAHVIKSQ